MERETSLGGLRDATQNADELTRNTQFEGIPTMMIKTSDWKYLHLRLAYCLL